MGSPYAVPAATLLILRVAAQADGDAMVEEPLPRSFHNLFVIAVGGMMLLWIAKVAYQLFRAADLNSRLAGSQSLHLVGLSLYADDFQVLIRQHFNQILRIRRTVPSKKVIRHQISAHVQPDSLALWSGEADGPRADGHFGLRFSVDALAPCSVRLFWGVSVSAANEFVARRQQSTGGESADARRGGSRGGPRSGAASSSRGASGAADPAAGRSLLEMEELNGTAVSQASAALFGPGQFALQSKEVFLTAGSEQRFASQSADLVDPAQLSFDLSAAWLREVTQMDDDSVVPLVIAIVSQKRPGREPDKVQEEKVIEVQGQLTFVKFVQSSSGGAGPGKPEVVRQVSFGDRSAHEVQGVFGFEDEGETECMICYSRPKNVLLLPCRHCSVCRPCLRSLRDEKCPLCRSVFSSYITFPISRSHLAQAPPEAPPPGPEPPPGGGGGGTGAGPPPSALPGPPGPGSAVAPGGTAAPGGATGLSSTAAPGAPAGAPAGASAALSAEKTEGLGLPSQVGPHGTTCPIVATPVALVEARHHTPPRDTPAPARGRGVAQAPRAAAQALRLSGRARCKDPTDTAQEPLLQDGGNAPQARLGSGSVESFCNRRGENIPVGEGSEETRVLIQSRDIV